MSRKSTAEYIKVKRARYADASLKKRPKIIDEAAETTGFSRKHVITS